jgi:hypothetical protein
MRGPAPDKEIVEMSRLQIPAGSDFLMQSLERRQLLTGSVVPSFVPVTISAGALSADPSLSNFQTFDLKVTISGTNDWASGDLDIKLSAGHLYVPSGHNTTAQQSAWAGQPNLEFDSFVTGPGFAQPTVLGTATINSTAFHVAWGDLVHTSPGTYTIARFTLSLDAKGQILGRIGTVDDPNNPTNFGSGVPLRTDGGSISGFVFNDVNANGSQEAGEPRYAGAHLLLDLNNNGHFDTGEPTVKTRSNGAYTFTGLAAGSYRVRINPNAGFRRTGPLPKLNWGVNIIGGAAAGGKWFGQTQKVLISGTVFNDGNGNGTKDSGELGRAGFTLWAETDNDQGRISCG